MLALTEKEIRASFINASVRERTSATLPVGFADLEWDRLDFLGWRDPKLPQVGYVVVRVDEDVVGVMLRASEHKARSRPQCVWCEDVTLPNDVVFFSVRRPGPAGRNGDTVGTLVCEGFQCSANVRKPPPPAYLGFDIEAARQHRMAALRENITAFARTLRDG